MDFIFQNKDLDESDYLGAKPEGKEILYCDRRFILGSKGLENELLVLRNFTSSQIGIFLVTLIILFPKSINRVQRKAGPGSKICSRWDVSARNYSSCNVKYI